MNIYLEIFGYMGTALVIISMMMKSINKLRMMNMAGGAVSGIYSAIIGAWPIVVMNACIITINLYYLIRAYMKMRKIKEIEQRERS